MSGGTKPKALGRPLDGWVRPLAAQESFAFASRLINAPLKAKVIRNFPSEIPWLGYVANYNSTRRASLI